MKLIAQKIKEIIESSEKTQIELAEAIKVNPKQIQRWKYGEQEIGATKLREFCKYYGVSADYVLGLEKEQQSKKIEQNQI